MNYRVSLDERRSRLAIERALDIRATVGRLREAARLSKTKLRREVLRGIVKKIERRREMNLSVRWWLGRAEEMLNNQGGVK